MTTRTAEMYSLAELGAYVERHWRRLLGIGVVGALAGLAFALATARVEVSVELANLPGPRQLSDKSDTRQETWDEADQLTSRSNKRALSLTEWLQLRRDLVNLALRIEEMAVSGDTSVVRRPWMGQVEWWNARVNAVMALSRNDIRGLAGTTQMLDVEASTVAGIVVSNGRRSEAQALDATVQSVAFVRSGAMYLQITRLIEGWRAEALTLGNHTARARLAAADLELRRLRQRQAMLESLTPAPPAPSQTIVSVETDRQAKYLPIRSQLNAVRVEIHDLLEEQDHLREVIARSALLSAFIAEAERAYAAAVVGEGFVLSDVLQGHAEQIAPAAPATDYDVMVARALSEQLLAQLLEQRTRFTALMPEVSRQVQTPDALHYLNNALMGFAAFVALALGLALLRSQLAG